MPLFSFEGKSPKIHPTAFIAPTASIIGDLRWRRTPVWYGTVLRGFPPS
jgi:carbonic anhydrase/acetyltransferase-like protein (isoleucine patch superfamily)